jgi:ElaB/YqjD/DUF883 family membrane-anchored ribosome-binding protein
MDSAGSDLESLVRDLNGLKETLTSFMSKASSEVLNSVRDVSSGLADTGAGMALNAIERGKGLATQLENTVRRNPLASIAGALVVGILLGVRGRRR